MQEGHGRTHVTHVTYVRNPERRSSRTWMLQVTNIDKAAKLLDMFASRSVRKDSQGSSLGSLSLGIGTILKISIVVLGAQLRRVSLHTNYSLQRQRSFW